MGRIRKPRRRINSTSRGGCSIRSAFGPRSGAYSRKMTISRLARTPFVLSLLAQAYEKSGDKAQALDYYRKVLTINTHGPTNAFARPLAKEKVAALSK